MNFPGRHLITCFLLPLVFLCDFAFADLVVGFSADNGESFQDSMDVRVDESINVEIYLRQTGSDSVLTDEGIISWGLDIARSSADLGTISDITPNPSFDFQNHNVITETGFEWEYAVTAGTGIKGNEILLGSFQFNSLSEGTTQFTLQDRIVGAGPGNATWFTPSFTELDQQIFGSGAAGTFQFSVNAISAVPEPHSFVLLCYMLGIMKLRRNRKP